VIKTIYILAIYIIFGTSCVQSSQKNKPLEIDKKASKSTKPEELPGNFWNNKSNWGAPFNMVDYSSQKTLFDDSRVNDIYKRELPEFTKQYVLFRVSHGHSCWIYSALVLLAYQLIDSGAENFASAIHKFENLANENSKYPHFRDFVNSGKLTKFIDVLKYINAHMSFRDSLDFMNHIGVENTLNEGLRAFIAANMRTTGDAKSAEKIEQDSLCWGYLPEASFLARIAKVEFSGLLIDGNRITFQHPQRNEIVEAHPDVKELVRRDEKGEDISQEEWDKATYRAFDSYFKTNLNKPKVLFFRSNPAYMDVAVHKSVAKKIRSNKAP
jgi:hypothetical protein